MRQRIELLAQCGEEGGLLGIGVRLGLALNLLRDGIVAEDGDGAGHLAQLVAALAAGHADPVVPASQCLHRALQGVQRIGDAHPRHIIAKADAEQDGDHAHRNQRGDRAAALRLQVLRQLGRVLQPAVVEVGELFGKRFDRGVGQLQCLQCRRVFVATAMRDRLARLRMHRFQLAANLAHDRLGRGVFLLDLRDQRLRLVIAGLLLRVRGARHGGSAVIGHHAIAVIGHRHQQAVDARQVRGAGQFGLGEPRIGLVAMGETAGTQPCHDRGYQTDQADNRQDFGGHLRPRKQCLHSGSFLHRRRSSRGEQRSL